MVHTSEGGPVQADDGRPAAGEVKLQFKQTLPNDTETFPALAGNPFVNGGDPDSLINIVLNGGTRPPTNKAPTAFAMSSFRDRLNDQEVADVLTFFAPVGGTRAPPSLPPKSRDCAWLLVDLLRQTWPQPQTW